MYERDLVERVIPHNITYEEIAKARVFRQALHIRLFDSKIYLLNGVKGEIRHAEILEQIFDLSERVSSLPNTEFKYYTMDTVYRQDVGSDSAIFTFWDDEKHGDLSRRILAPSSFFSGYWSGKFMTNSLKVKYQDEIDRIVNYTEENTMPFSKKENSLIFKGKVSLYPHRVAMFEELKEKIGSVSEFLVHDRGARVLVEGNTQYQNPIEYLGKFRYQLVTNGAHRTPSLISGTCRSKYMLATGGIVIYITDGSPKKEWWQHLPGADDVIVYCDTVDAAIEKIRWYENNPDAAEAQSRMGLDFVKSTLNYENVMNYWSHLLQTYKNRCLFEISSPAGTLLESKEHVWDLV